MYTYINRRTGASFESQCECAGKDWEKVPSPPPAEEKPKRKKKVDA